MLARLLAHGGDRVAVLRIGAIDVRAVAPLEHVLDVEELRHDDEIRLFLHHPR
jgi:hypothetical protein